MKYLLRLLFFSCFLLLGAVVSAQEPFVIEGRVSGVADSTMLVLHENDSRLLEPVDTAYVVAGKFAFRYPTDKKTRLAILCFSGDFPPMLLQVWAEPGVTATITGENTLLYTWEVESPVAEQQERQRYIRPVKAQWEEIQRQRMAMSGLYHTLAQSRNRPIEEVNAAQEQIAALESRGDSIQLVIYRKLMPLLMQAEPTALYVNQLIGLSDAVCQQAAFGELRDDALALYERLTPEQKAAETGKSIRVNLTVEDRVQTGGSMADAELPDASGDLHRLSDYKGRYILLDFWASWCGPCVASIPELKEAAALYEDRLTIIGINLDEKRENWLTASEKHAISWIDLYAGGRPAEVSVQYRENGIPHQVLISPEGIVLNFWGGYFKGFLKRQLEHYIPLPPLQDE